MTEESREMYASVSVNCDSRCIIFAFNHADIAYMKSPFECFVKNLQ